MLLFIFIFVVALFGHHWNEIGADTVSKSIVAVTFVIVVVAVVVAFCSFLGSHCGQQFIAVVVDAHSVASE